MNAIALDNEACCVIVEAFCCSQSLFTLNLIEDYLSRSVIPNTEDTWMRNKNYFSKLTCSLLIAYICIILLSSMLYYCHKFEISCALSVDSHLSHC